MLKHLHIQNIILIEDTTVSFEAGLNILTGETGSGKSAIMHGLNLAIGDRADTTIVRRDCAKGIVEAIFEVQNPAILALLHAGGIEHEVGQELIIRREIATSGKGRIFINHQSAQLTFLRQLGTHLVHVVGQHANQHLLSLDYHRQVLDLYSDLISLGERFQASYRQEQELRRHLEQLLQQEAQRLREIDVCQHELEELEEAQIQEGEDEELFAEYTRLVHAEELVTKTRDITQVLAGERQSVLLTLRRQQQLLASLVVFDASLEETAQAFQNALLELQEVSHTLLQYQGRLSHDPERLIYVNERLTLITRLKRKYGITIQEMLAYQKQTMLKLTQLENADTEISQLEEDLQRTTATTSQLAQELTRERQQNAILLAHALTQQLQKLNMHKAQFKIQVTAQKRSEKGEDRVEFFLEPNVGEHQIALREGASGGEISRVLLALQTLLAGKEQTDTLIFDEVDANIGGETATFVGNNLRQMSEKHQVICITHFPQVASQAHHHLQISKQEKAGRTVTLIQELDADSRQQELARMAGGLKAVSRQNVAQTEVYAI